MESPVRVFLIHRHRLLADALVAALAGESRVVLVGRAGHLDEASRRLAGVHPDVVLMETDPEAPPPRPMIRHLASAFPRLKVVPMGLDSNERVLECIEAGAGGYLPLDTSLAHFVETLELIGEDRAPCPPSLAVSAFARIAELARRGDGERRSRRRPQATRLTPRERQVLARLARGLANKEIAGELGIAVATVKNHVHRILEKLDVSRRHDAVRILHETGLVELLGTGDEGSHGS